MKYTINYNTEGKILGFVQGKDGLNKEVDNATYIKAMKYNKIIIDGDNISFDKIDWRTQAELDKKAITDKWNELNTFLSSLTVQRSKTATVDAGFKFSADPESIANISLEIDTMLDTDTRTWYEDWGTATVTKQELQEAKRLASEAKQAKLAELFGA